MPRRKVALGTKTVEVLDVPYVTQRPHLNFCVVAALKMAWDYIRSAKGAGLAADVAPDLSMDNIAALTRVDPLTGVTISQDLIDRINEEQTLVEAKLVWKLDNNGLVAAQQNDLPVVALYYPSMCEHPGTSTSGISHACVFLGATNEKVLIHNPWYGPFHSWPAPLYDRSRKNLGGAAITFSLRAQKTLDATPAVVP